MSWWRTCAKVSLLQFMKMECADDAILVEERFSLKSGVPADRS